MLELTLNERGHLFPDLGGDFCDDIDQLPKGDPPIDRPNFITEQIEQPSN
jgi:hypothetical protein